MPLFDIAVREHTYTGRFYHDVVQAGSCEEALQVASGHAAVTRPVPGPTPQGFSIVVTEQAYAGPVYSDVVQAGSCEEALQAAAEQAAAPEPPPGPATPAAAAVRPMCSDVWIYGLLHCRLEAGHDPPHMAIVQRYGRPARWVRDRRGIAHAVPDQAGAGH